MHLVTKNSFWGNIECHSIDGRILLFDLLNFVFNTDVRNLQLIRSNIADVG